MTIWLVIFWSAVVLLVYSQLGYPLLLSLLAVFRPKLRPPEATILPKVSMIIPVNNEEQVLARKLENALAIDYPKEKLEIIVASDGSTDRTLDIGHSFQSRGVRLLEFHSRRGKSNVVGDAVREATGEVLCLCDANVLLETDALRRMVAHLQDQRIGAVTGDVKLASDQSEFGEGEMAYYWLERCVQEKESLLGSTIGVDGGMYIVRRELYEPIPDTILDDFVIAMKVIQRGKRVIYERTAVAHETATVRPIHEFRRRVRVAAGTVQALKRGHFPGLRTPVVFWQFCSHKLLRWTGPIWLFALLISSVALFQHGLVFRLALAAQALAYLIAALGTLIPVVRHSRAGGVVFYFVLSHLAMAVGLFKGLANLQSAAWARTERCGLPKASASNPNVLS